MFRNPGNVNVVEKEGREGKGVILLHQSYFRFVMEFAGLDKGQIVKKVGGALVG